MFFEIFNSRNSNRIQEKSPDFYSWFMYIAKNIKRCFQFLSCNQIWLNLHVDHWHFGHITKLTKEKTLRFIVHLFLINFAGWLCLHTKCKRVNLNLVLAATTYFSESKKWETHESLDYRISSSWVHDGDSNLSDLAWLSFEQTLRM